ncbi:MAG TPA: alpha/beta hydrolase, partial [Agriterribacter sp.]|nr:alpha/beta hydrolase [Agriterribacter sp.]
SSPGTSASFRWATIYQQTFPLQFSRIQLERNLAGRTISGKTDNVLMLKLALAEFGQGGQVKIILDSADAVTYSTVGMNDSIYLQKEGGRWNITDAPGFEQKGPHRYGTFKEAFNHKMVFVYGTKGNKAENEWAFNKARYDAESWYYRGNGAVDVITDKEYATGKFANRGVILFGNAQTNSAWNLLLSNSPIQVNRNAIKVGDKTWTGDDLAAYFIWPINNSPNTSVGVIAGTGLKGMGAANANQYFAGGSGFPDYMVFRLNMLHDGGDAIECAGFFDNHWQLDDKNNSVKE